MHLVGYTHTIAETNVLGKQEEQTEKSNLVSSEKGHRLAQTSSSDLDGTVPVRKEESMLALGNNVPRVSSLYIMCLCLLCMNFVWMLFYCILIDLINDC